MASSSTLKKVLRKKLREYEGEYNHLYLDTRGKVTIAVGHLISNKKEMGKVDLYKVKNKVSVKLANLQEKYIEYDNIKKLPWGQRYGAAWYEKYTTLRMKKADIDKLLDMHLAVFYKELVHIYTKSRGYPENFDDLPNNVQLALFDMIFNLGGDKILKLFVQFDNALKAGDWKKAAIQSNRPDVSKRRNKYVRNLFNNAPVILKTPKP